MYVKVKRRRLTLFVRAQPSDSVNTVRDSVYSSLFSQGSSTDNSLGDIDVRVCGPEDIALMTAEQTMLDGTKSLVDSNIENGSVLCLVRKKTDGTFEPPCVTSTDDDQNGDDEQLEDS
ncbi:hypothetical protein PSENEW3_00001394 [Picochlorum sp. SENEW3]|nr:hypothetical protein PSENEW3_00001394 [Picochlorum sp. SENEW3]